MGKVERSVPNSLKSINFPSIFINYFMSCKEKIPRTEVFLSQAQVTQARCVCHVTWVNKENI